MAEKILMLALSPTMDEGAISAWKLKEGDPVKSGDVLCEVETDKAVMDYESAVSGIVLKLVKAAGERARVGDLIAVIGKPGEDIAGLLGPSPAPVATMPGRAVPATTAPVTPAPGRTVQAPIPLPGGHPRSSPLARALARQEGLDIRSVQGTGPGGRVIRRDILAAREAPARATAPAADRLAGSSRTASAGPAAGRAALKDETVPVSGMRAVIARRLAESMYSAPHYYLSSSVGMDRLLDLRAAVNAAAADKLTLNSFLMKLAAEAIKLNPVINASWKETVIEKHASVDIGLAVALPDGLVTPLVRNCGAKSIHEIDAELADLVERARAGRLKSDEYTGATFTISNLGSFGVDEFTAIINPPASAILAVGAVAKQALVDEHDQLVVRRLMRLTLSCDHRVIDGAVGAAFLRDLRLIIEEPARALI